MVYGGRPWQEVAMMSWRVGALVSGVVALGIGLAAPAFAQFPGPGAPGLPPAPIIQVQALHGIVQEVDGSTFTFIADDGRTLTVDMSHIAEDVRGALTPGEGVTVLGVPGDDANRLIARHVQQDPSTDPSRRTRE
jgi:hypothetical protein